MHEAGRTPGRKFESAGLSRVKFFTPKVVESIIREQVEQQKESNSCLERQPGIARARKLANKLVDLVVEKLSLRKGNPLIKNFTLSQLNRKMDITQDRKPVVAQGKKSYLKKKEKRNRSLLEGWRILRLRKAVLFPCLERSELQIEDGWDIYSGKRGKVGSYFRQSRHHGERI